jgi:hypothetical protein
MRLARRADNSAVLVVPNAKIRRKPNISSPPLNLLDLLGKALFFTFSLLTGLLNKLSMYKNKLVTV